MTTTMMMITMTVVALTHMVYVNKVKQGAYIYCKHVSKGLAYEWSTVQGFTNIKGALARFHFSLFVL